MASTAAAAAGPVHQCKDRRRGLVGRMAIAGTRRWQKVASHNHHLGMHRPFGLCPSPDCPLFRTSELLSAPPSPAKGWHRQEYRTLQKVAPGIWPTTAHACQHQQKLATLPNIRCAEIADASPPQLEACSFENGQFASCWRRDCGTNDLLRLNWHEGYGPCADTGTHGQCSFELLTPLSGTPICPHREGQTPSVTVHHCPRG